MSQRVLNGDISFYVINSEGLSLFHADISDNNYPDPQLVSGLTAALMSFSSSLYNKDEYPDYLIVKTKLGDDYIENRLRKYDELYSLFILKNVGELSNNAYGLLDELGKMAVEEVRNYVGGSLSKDLSSVLKEKIETEIEVIKEQIYTSYLMDILATSLNYGIKKTKAEELIVRLSRVYNSNDLEAIKEENNCCREEIVKLAKGEKSKTLRVIISTTNKKDKDVWRLFYVPIIKQKEYQD